MEGLSVRINKLFIREQTGELCRDVQGVSAVYTIKSETNEKQIFQKNSTNTHTPPPGSPLCRILQTRYLFEKGSDTLYRNKEQREIYFRYWKIFR